MTDTKPVLTPRVGDIVRCEGFGRIGNTLMGVKPDSPIKVDAIFEQGFDMDPFTVIASGRLRIGLRSVVEILPAQEEKPKVEPASDEEIQRWKDAPSKSTGFQSLIARIEADQVNSRNLKSRLVEAEKARTSIYDEWLKMKAQNAEQAQEIARLKWTIASMAHRREGAPYPGPAPDRRKGERRRWIQVYYGTGTGRRMSPDRRKAK